MIIKLDEYQLTQGWIVGHQRRIESVAGGLNNRKNSRKGTTIVDDDKGACSELAVAVGLGTYWPRGVNTFHSEPDVLPDIDVKSTPYATGHLILREDDPDNRRFVLVIANPPYFRLAGWIPCASAYRQPQWWREDAADGRPGHWIPQDQLMPMTSFIL